MQLISSTCICWVSNYKLASSPYHLGYKDINLSTEAKQHWTRGVLEWEATWRLLALPPLHKWQYHAVLVSRSGIASLSDTTNTSGGNVSIKRAMTVASFTQESQKNGQKVVDTFGHGEEFLSIFLIAGSKQFQLQNLSHRSRFCSSQVIHRWPEKSGCY